jgi:hypothetical protein
MGVGMNVTVIRLIEDAYETCLQVTQLGAAVLTQVDPNGALHTVVIPQQHRERVALALLDNPHGPDLA